MPGWLRIVVRVVSVIVAVCLLLFAALLGVTFLPTHFPATNAVTEPNPHVKPYYMALGDSLAFGFQPNFNWDQGYAEQWWPELQRHGSRSFIDLACNGETTSTFIHGGCIDALVRHVYYSGSQLDEAVRLLHQHQGQVSPVTLDLGADDVTHDLDISDCRIHSADFGQQLTQLDAQMKGIILPKLVAALTDSHGQRTGDLLLLNYYDPAENHCPAVRPYMQTLNANLARDAAQFGIPLVDVYSAFGSNQHPNPNICKFTWRCTILHSIHPDTAGYAVMTKALEEKTGY